MYTTDRTRHERFRALQAASPEAATLSPTYGWLNETIASAARLRTGGFFDQLRAPVKVAIAGAERRLDPSAQALLGDAHEKMSTVTIDGALHEILVERDEIRDAFWKVFDAWIAEAYH